MSRTSQEIRLAARPQGRPDASTWQLATTEVAEPGPGEFLVQLQQISLDPAMRGWLNDVRSYLPPVQIGAVMRAFGAGTVIASQHDDFAVGDVVSGTFGVREYAISDGNGVARLDLDVAPMSTWLGALGMPGMTAWFGLEDVGRAQPGDTVLVSAAAGAVGSTVAQLAKAKGCRVIGVAGGSYGLLMAHARAFMTPQEIGRGVRQLKVGDKVIYGQYAGSTYKADGIEYKVLREDDILAVIG